MTKPETPEDNGEDRAQKIREIYRYDEMANKVLHTDKRLQTFHSDPLKDAELSQPKSMRGRIQMKDMGQKATNELAPEERKEAEREVTKTLKSDEKLHQNRSKSNVTMNDNRTILDMNTGFKLKYYPTDESNTSIYEDILQWVTNLLGNDIPHDIIVETTDILIFTLKSETIKGTEVEKKTSIETDLGIPIDQQKFTDLIKLSNEITDFNSNMNQDEETERTVAILSHDKDDNIFENNLDADESDDDIDEKNALEQELIMEEDIGDEESETTTKPTKMELDSNLLPNKEDVIIMERKEEDMLPTISLINREYVKRKIQNELAEEDDRTIANVTNKLIKLLKSIQNDSAEFNEKIVSVVNPKKYATLIAFLSKHQAILSWGIKLSETDSLDVNNVLEEMKMNNLELLVNEYLSSNNTTRKRALDSEDEDSHIEGNSSKKNLSQKTKIPPIIDLDTITFDQGSKLLTVNKVNLPEGSFKKVKDTYDEIHIPAPKAPSIHYPLVSISELPEWVKIAFPSKETEVLNAIQSKVFPKVFKDDSNLLLCAPTGGGKTNVAMLGILRALSHCYNESTKKFNLSNFKIVYIAPLKALVQEQVREFQRRLIHLGIKVAELTGDSRLTKQEISQTHILVSTPEKWDVITRKMDDSSFVFDVRLIIIDEIHLLHDSRGPVLENIVSRILFSKYWLLKPRIIALSATLPNYIDVAKFLRVPDHFVFYFDSSYRPCPLTQQFCGIREQSALKKVTAMNNACYDKVMESLSENNQVIIFVHSRKETARTATWLKNKFLETDNVKNLRPREAGSKEILVSESNNVKDHNLKKLVEYGIGIHHAGLARDDRSLSEDLFADGLLRVLVSTATLAWGVNLPAHTVIIKGTDVYSPEKGGWEQLSPQDILQMLGRAGRPRYDTHGEGIIITNQSDIQYYLAVLNQQLPIESQLMSRISDSINAEIVATNIKSRNDVMKWLTYTYLYIRMLVSPELYRVDTIDGSDEPNLVSFRSALAHSALTQLKNQQLVLYNEDTGLVEPTELGRIASYFYIKPESISIYNRELTDRSSIIDMFRIFSLSDEFKYISVRQEERRELQELVAKSPIPSKDDTDSSTIKVNILLQAYISQLKFEGFALNADMVFIQQNAGRLLRAMYELCLKQRWSQPTKTLLNLCKSVKWRMWTTNTPLKQFKKCPTEVIKRAETSTLPWSEYLKFNNPSELGKAIRVESNGKLVYDLIQRFPIIKLQSTIQPLTPSLLIFDLQITPCWIWDKSLHGVGEVFLIFVEDTDGKEILFEDSVLIREADIDIEQSLSFSIQLSSSQQKRLPPTFYITVMSEKWWHSGSTIPVILDSIQLPKKLPPPRDLGDINLVSTQSLENDEFVDVFNYSSFNIVESSVFPTLYKSNDNILIGCPKGTGKTDMALLAILNHWRQNKGRALYISTSQGRINNILKKWNKMLSNIAGGKNINKLGDDLSSNLKLLAQSHLLLSTPQQFDAISRNWRKRKNVQRIELIILDDLDSTGKDSTGYLYENMISRLTFMISQLESNIRVVGLSSCLPNGRDLGEWIGVEKENVFNYSPGSRLNPVEIHLQSFPNTYHSVYTSSMLRCAFDKIISKTNGTGSLIYVNSRKYGIEIARKVIDLSRILKWDMLNIENEQLESLTKSMVDHQVRENLLNGAGILYAGMNKKDKRIVQNLYEHGAFSVLLVTKDLCYESPKSDLVTILGTEYFDFKESRYVNYPAADILEMLGNVKSDNQKPGKLLLLTSDNQKSYYKKFMSEPAPIESYMYYFLHDSFINEINNLVITSKQDCIDWLTYTYFYRRIHANPSFYGVTDNSAYGISAYLTELVETTINDLVTTNIVEVQEAEDEESSDIISPLNGCLIASHYNISFLTMNTFTKTLTKTSTLRDILLALSYATEFETISVDRDDIPKLSKLEKLLPLKYLDDKRINIVSYKVFILLQAYFSRLSLSVEFKNSLQTILGKVEPLINGMVDILSGEGYLNATTAMDLSQMLIQAVWDIDIPLKQVPFFTNDILDKCKDLKVETVYDIMALNDDDRETIMTMDEQKLVKLANFINNYPNIEMDYTLDNKSFKSNQSIVAHITLRKDDEPETLSVTSECYPYEKTEKWWIVVGDSSKRELYAIKKATLSAETQQYDIPFELTEVGKHDITIWCVCDSYQDADKEVSFSVNIV